MPCSNDDYIRLDGVDVVGSLLLPADSSSHMAISWVDLGELKERLDRTVHSPQLPTLDGVHGIDDSGGVDEGCIERKSELQIGEVRVGTLDGRSGSQKAEVTAGRRGQEIFCGAQNILLEVECPVVPSERKLVPPYT